jgi:putative transposase
MSTLFGMFLFVEKLIADAGYQGPQFANALAKALPQIEIEIVKLLLPKLWIVERSIAWLSRCRRLAKHWENLSLSALVFLRLASIRLMLRKLCNPS